MKKERLLSANYDSVTDDAANLLGRGAAFVEKTVYPKTRTCPAG